MPIEKRVLLEDVTVKANGILEIRERFAFFEDGVLIARGDDLRRTIVPQLATDQGWVDASIAIDDHDKIKTLAAAAWTEEVKATYRAEKEQLGLGPPQA